MMSQVGERRSQREPQNAIALLVYPLLDVHG
jgi:hypothetical protein